MAPDVRRRHPRAPPAPLDFIIDVMTTSEWLRLAEQRFTVRAGGLGLLFCRVARPGQSAGFLSLPFKEASWLH